MSEHLSIGLQGGTAVHRQRILDRAAADPRAFPIEDAADRHTIVLCESDEAAALERARYAASQRLSHTCCTVEMDDYGVRVNLEGTDGARAALHDLLHWLLAACGPCRVWDDETRQEVPTDQLETLFS